MTEYFSPYTYATTTRHISEAVETSPTIRYSSAGGFSTPESFPIPGGYLAWVSRSPGGSTQARAIRINQTVECAMNASYELTNPTSSRVDSYTSPVGMISSSGYFPFGLPVSIFTNEARDPKALYLASGLEMFDFEMYETEEKALPIHPFDRPSRIASGILKGQSVVSLCLKMKGGDVLFATTNETANLSSSSSSSSLSSSTKLMKSSSSYSSSSSSSPSSSSKSSSSSLSSSSSSSSSSTQKRSSSSSSSSLSSSTQHKSSSSSSSLSSVHPPPGMNSSSSSSSSSPSSGPHVLLRSTSNNNGTTSITIAQPSGLQVNDMMIAHISVKYYGCTITPPSGWSSFYGDINSSGGFHNKTDNLFWKVATSSDVNSWNGTFSSSPTTYIVFGSVTAFSGVDISNPPTSCFTAAIGSENNAGTYGTNYNDIGGTFAAPQTATNPGVANAKNAVFVIFGSSLDGPSVNMVIGAATGGYYSIANGSVSWSDLYNVNG